MFYYYNEIEDLDFLNNNDEVQTGEVLSVGDGIVYVSGLENIESGAVVDIESS